MTLRVLLLSLLQRWMGRPVRGCGGIRAGSRGGNHHEAAIWGGQDLWWLLSEAASGQQHQKPLVLRVLAVPFPVPPCRPPSGEQELQEGLLRWVEHVPWICLCFRNRSSVHIDFGESRWLHSWIITKTVNFFSLFSPLQYSLLLLPTGDHGKLCSWHLSQNLKF